MRVGCKCWPWPRAIEKGFKRIEEGEGEKEGEGEEGRWAGRQVEMLCIAGNMNNNSNKNDSQGKVEQHSLTLRNYAQQTCHSIEQA